MHSADTETGSIRDHNS